MHCLCCTAYNALFILHSAHCMHAVMNFAERLHCMHTSLQNYHAQTSLHCTNCTVHTALLILYTTVVLHSKMQYYNNVMVDFTVQISSLSSSVCVLCMVHLGWRNWINCTFHISILRMLGVTFG